MNAKNQSCKTCAVGSGALLGTLCSCDQALVTREKRRRIYSRGDFIYQAGDYANSVCCIQTGNVRIYTIGNDGKEQTYRFAKPGELVGFRALLLSEPYESFAVAMDTVRVCIIPKSTFDTIVSRNIAFSKQLLVSLALELNDIEHHLTDVIQRPVLQRLAETLLTWKQTYGTHDDRKTIGLQITRIELARYLGTTPESVSRSLSLLQEDGLIHISGKAISIENSRKLADVASLHD